MDAGGGSDDGLRERLARRRLWLLALIACLGSSAPAPAAALGAYRDAVLADGPAGYWRLGEAVGATTAADSAGANDGTYSNGVTLDQAGAVPDSTSAAAFDGSNDTVRVAHAAALSPTTGLTVEAWVKPARLSSTAGILRKGSTYQLRVNSDGAVKFYLHKGGTRADLQTGSGAVKAAAWSHVAATWNGTTMQIYVDGVSRATKSFSGPADATSDPLYIASEKGSSSFYAGSLDEVAVYGKALSAAQVNSHYQAGKGAAPAPPPPPAPAPDTTPPAVTLTSPAQAETVGATPTFDGKAGTATGDKQSVTVKVYAGAAVGGTPVQTLTDDTIAAGTYSATARPLANGQYTAQAEQLDAAGNKGVSNARTFMVQASTLPGSVVGLWHMDETSGTTMVDSSGKNNHGTATGVIFGRPGKLGLAYEFGGKSIVKSSGSLNPGSKDFSVSMWINFKDPPATSMDLIRKGFSTTAGGDFKFEIRSGGNARCYVRDGSDNSVSVSSSGDLSDQSWHHVECRRTGATFRVIVDKAKTTSKTASLGAVSNSQTLNIGSKNAVEDHYVGLMDEARMTIG